MREGDIKIALSEDKMVVLDGLIRHSEATPDSIRIIPIKST
jgi:hypothetical protein